LQIQSFGCVLERCSSGPEPGNARGEKGNTCYCLKRTPIQIRVPAVSPCRFSKVRKWNKRVKADSPSCGRITQIQKERDHVASRPMAPEVIRFRPRGFPSLSRMRAIWTACWHAPGCFCPPLSKTAGAEPARESHHEQLPWHTRTVGPWRPSWHQDNTDWNIWCMGSLHSERILRPTKAVAQIATASDRGAHSQACKVRESRHIVVLARRNAHIDQRVDRYE
jgi:hypothetical protein